MKNFVKSIPTVEQKILNLTATDHKGHESKENNNNRECPPIRATKIINPNKTQTISSTDTKKEDTKPAPKLSNKSPKPKDYGEWNKSVLVFENIFVVVEFWLKIKKSFFSELIE